MAVAIGFLTGYFSGHFGVGGGLLTTPAIRVFLGEPAFIAVGTPLLVNIPSAALGAWSYRRRGLVAMAPVPYLAGFGVIGVILGSLLTPLIGGDLILLVTAAVILFVGLRLIVRREPTPRPTQVGPLGLSLAGTAIGVCSGILGLGGGFLLVPYLRVVLGLDIKTTFGTSLLIVAVLTVPGALVHYFLGHVDLQLGLLLIVGIVPGVLVGVRVAMRLPGALLQIMFGGLMILLALYLGYFEVVKLAN